VCATAEQLARSAAAQEHLVVAHTRQRDVSLCSRILAIGRATPGCRVTQEASFRLSRYERDGASRGVLNTGIDFRHFYFEPEPRLCLDMAGLSPRDVDLLVARTSTGYVCPDIGTRHMLLILTLAPQSVIEGRRRAAHRCR
jgi:hypothetical protein